MLLFDGENVSVDVRWRMLVFVFGVEVCWEILM